MTAVAPIPLVSPELLEPMARLRQRAEGVLVEVAPVLDALQDEFVAIDDAGRAELGALPDDWSVGEDLDGHGRRSTRSRSVPTRGRTAGGHSRGGEEPHRREPPAVMFGGSRVLDVAKEQGFNALLTISNEIPATPGAHPTEVDKRKLRKVELHHLSWTQILTEAVMEKLYRGVADPDQAWILGELIRYLEHPRSGAMELDDMGAGWVPVREAVRAGTLRAHDKAAQEVAARWDQLVRFASLRLGRQLGTEVAIAMPRKELMDPALRTQHLLDSLITTGCLEGALRILETVGPVRVRADLRAGQLFASVDIDAPRDGRPQTRINWLVRQLKEAPDTLRIEAFAAHQRASTADLLRQVRADPTVLIGDPKKEIKSFTVTMNSPLGAKRGAGRGGFVASVLDLLDDFYGSTVQNLKPWSAPAPKLRKPAPEDADGQVLTSTALSSQDGPDPSYASHAAPQAVAETPASPAE